MPRKCYDSGDTDVERERRTVWDGVKNPQALRAIREMHPADRVFMYHSQGDAAIVGLAKVASEPRPDPKDPKLSVVDFEFVSRLETPTFVKMFISMCAASTLRAPPPRIFFSSS